MTVDTDALRVVPDEMVFAFQGWYLKHTGKRIFARNAAKAVQAVLGAALAVQPAAGRIDDDRPLVERVKTWAKYHAHSHTRSLLEECAAALAHPPAQGSESGGEVEGAARALLDACYTADENSDLSDFIDGTLLTRLDRALSARVLAALSQPGPASEGDEE